MEGTHSARNVVRFGLYEVDLRSGDLRKQGVRIKLQKQPFELLQVLLENPGEVVSREELQQRIWPTGTFVDFEQGLSNAIKRLREALCDSAENPRFIETVPRRGYRFLTMPGRVPSERIESLAVLPLENLSRDPEQEYFADGLTEALITSLGKIGSLRVVSRTSAMQYKGARGKSLREIAKELEVDGIVEGAVIRSGERVRISVRLINASTDTQVWCENYDRDLRDILTLHSEVARAIVHEIQIKLTPREQSQLARTQVVDPEAYEAYLKGRHHWNKRSPEGVRVAGKYFQQAIDRAPAYAAAYAGLADCAGSAGFWGFLPPAEGCGKAKAAAKKALEIEETAEAHASLGWAILHHDWDFPGSEREMQRAIECDPRYATAHQWYGHCLGYWGRFDEGLAETRRALQLDPFSLIIHASHAGSAWVARDWDYGIAHCHQALELGAYFTPLHWLLAHVYQGKGKYEEAIAERQRAVELSGDAPVYIAELGGTYAAAGRAEEALRILSQMKELSARRYVMAYWFALIYAGLKDVDQSLSWLQKAEEERSPMAALAGVDPRLDTVRSDPRFEKLFGNLGR